MALQSRLQRRLLIDVIVMETKRLKTYDGRGFGWWLSNKWTGNDGAAWRWISAVMMWVCHLDVGRTMQLSCWRPCDHLAHHGNVLERRILGGAIIQRFTLCAVHDGAHAALRRHPLWSSFRSDIRRLRVRVTYSAVDWVWAPDLVLVHMHECCTSLYAMYANTSVICKVHIIKLVTSRVTRDYYAR